MVGGRVTTPGQLMGSDIKGGQTHHLSKGDVIVIPARTPHWFKEVPQSVSYYVVKVLKQDGFMFSKACWSYRWRIHPTRRHREKAAAFSDTDYLECRGLFTVNVVHPCPYVRLRSIKARFDPSSHLILLEPRFGLEYRSPLIS
jgi:hypothetical protein